jgi:hypothetical protein
MFSFCDGIFLLLWGCISIDIRMGDALNDVSETMYHHLRETSALMTHLCDGHGKPNVRDEEGVLDTG